jgi:hypothetical protein
MNKMTIKGADPHQSQKTTVSAITSMHDLQSRWQSYHYQPIPAKVSGMQAINGFGWRQRVELTDEEFVV